MTALTRAVIADLMLSAMRPGVDRMSSIFFWTLRLMPFATFDTADEMPPVMLLKKPSVTAPRLLRSSMPRKFSLRAAR